MNPAPRPLKEDIRHLDEEQQGPYLRGQLSDELERTDTSMDHLLLLGSKVGQVASPHIDQIVGEWLSEDLSLGRADVVGSFLMGYWQRATISPDLLQVLFGAVEAIRRQGMLEPSSVLFAFHIAYKKGGSDIQTMVLHAFDRFDIELRKELV